MQVFKFGGASVKDDAGIRNVVQIIKDKGGATPLVIVVSATGKTTNQLEKVVEAKFIDISLANRLLQEVKRSHENIAEQLFGSTPNNVFQEINDHIVEAEWIIEETREMEYEYVYDQIVSIGELISSRLLAAWMSHQEIDVEWIDARNVVQTDDTYQEGRIAWNETTSKINAQINPILSSGKMVVSQGFIGSTKENNTTTLGREGSDYTAAIFSAALKAEAMVIWKDVPGILTADPNKFDNVTKLDRLSYSEAIEMTYYGAKVIHPKTIQPLQQNSIPLYVKSFIDPSGEGSLISGDIDLEYPPIVVLEPNQALVHFATRDLSFVAEHHLAHLFDLFQKHRIKVNMMRNTAISFSVCVTNDKQRISNLIQEVQHEFKVIVDHDLELITVRHYLDAMLPKLLAEKIVLLEERIRKTLQMVVKSAPNIIPKSL